MADRLELQRIASAFRVVGWGAFWSQLTLALVSAGVLAFNSIGSELVSNRDKAIGLGPGLSLTTLALLILAWGVWQDWGLVRISRSLASPSMPRYAEHAIESASCTDTLTSAVSVASDAKSLSAIPTSALKSCGARHASCPTAENVNPRSCTAAAAVAVASSSVNQRR